MKNQKHTMIFALILSTLLTISAQAATGQEGKGGGGVHKNERYMSFYTAGLYTEPQPVDDPIDIPGVIPLLSFVQEFPYWSAIQKTALINAIIPSQSHQYFKVVEDKFDEATKARLIAEFARVTKQPIDNLQLYAVTDTRAHITYLLPEFYQLSPEDQVAILFHESYWLMFPKTDYDAVINVEMAFEAVYIEPNNTARIMTLLGLYGDKNYSLEVQIKSDLESGALSGLLANDLSIPMSAIVGADLINCKGNNCVEGMVSINIYRLMQQYPKSLLIRRLWQGVQPAENASSGAKLYYANGRGISESYLRKLDSPLLYVQVGTKKKTDCDLGGIFWGRDLCRTWTEGVGATTSLASCKLLLSKGALDGALPIICTNKAQLTLLP